ncbi:MAG: hypothetical protein HWE27_07505 [Gammaproteobacteria bacterium]|nr:hypothetical protein [Gammaproteobacteria bacterium]
MGESVLPWLLVIEIILPFIILALVLTVVLIRGKSRLKDAMRELIINVKDNEPVQKESTQRFLHEQLGISEAETEKLSNALIKERKFFIRTLVSSLLNKDIEALATLDEELSRLTERYHALKPANTAATETSDSYEDDESSSALQSEVESKVAEIEELKDKNKGLQQELHITITTLNNIFSEYSSMFGEEVTKKDMSVEQILTAMESFSGTKSTESSSEPLDISTPQEETETVDDLEFNDSEAEDESNNESESSPLDAPLEDVNPGGGDDEPSWEDAFEESGDEMDKDKS